MAVDLCGFIEFLRYRIHKTLQNPYRNWQVEKTMSKSDSDGTVDHIQAREQVKNRQHYHNGRCYPEGQKREE